MTSFYSHKGQYLRPLLKLIGAKQKSRDRLYPLFPKGYSIYIEPFLGSGAVLMGLEDGNFRQLCSDKNSHITNFYQVVKDEDPDLIYESVQYYINRLREDGHYGEKGGSRYFYWLRDQEDEYKANPFSLAIWTYVINKVCFNGILRWNNSGKCNSSYCGTAKGRGWITREWIHAVKKRLQNVNLNNIDFEGVLDRHLLNDKAFVFLDPPYFLKGEEDPNGSVTVYNGEKFTTEDHERLLGLLKCAKFKWMMTINDCDWVRDSYRDFHIRPNTVNYSCSQTDAGRGPKTELIIMNYEVDV